MYLSTCRTCSTLKYYVMKRQGRVRPLGIQPTLTLLFGSRTYAPPDSECWVLLGSIPLTGWCSSSTAGQYYYRNRRWDDVRGCSKQANSLPIASTLFHLGLKSFLFRLWCYPGHGSSSLPPILLLPTANGLINKTGDPPLIPTDSNTLWTLYYIILHYTTLY